MLIKNFINESLEELLRINSQQQSEALSPNLALRRFTQHFKDLFSKNIAISLKVWEENFIKLESFSKNFVLTKELSNVIKVRDKFLAELKSIETSVIDKTCKAAREEAIELYRAPVGRIARFLVQDTSTGTIFLVLSLEACYGYVWHA